MGVQLPHMPPKGVPRLKPDPTIGLRDLMKPMMKFMDEQGSNDLLSLIEPPSEVSWKTKPLAGWLCTMAPLLEKLLCVDPKCIYPAKKMAEALERIQKDHHRVNFSRLRDDQFVDKVCLYIRVAASQLRDLCTKGEQYQRTMRKASLVEKQVLDSLPDKVQVENDQGEGNLEQGEVLITKPKEAEKSSEAGVVKGSENIFSRNCQHTRENYPG